MAKKRVLLQWIGIADLKAMAVDSPDDVRQKIVDKYPKGGLPKSGDFGPTKTLVETQEFDEVHLLTNYSREFNEWYASWLGCEPIIHPVDFESPNDYGAIYKASNSVLEELRSSKNWAETELCLHLSPGTGAMVAVLLLLGKTRFPATFYQTYQAGSSIPNIPFDLIDVIPEVYQEADRHFAYLSAESPSEVQGFEDIVGDSDAIRQAVGRAKRAALTSVNVLLLGESGTGKEMFAQAIHHCSNRRKKRFIAINCASLSGDLLRSELFGHKQGAFTGADKDRKGAFESADGGTLFLDEVGECDMQTQAELLRVLQSTEGPVAASRFITRVGDTDQMSVNVRIIAATNRDPHQAITDKNLREDLYYRLKTLSITLPPLRERRGDIADIASSLLKSINQQFTKEQPGYQPKALSESALAFSIQHIWPGNVRQLANLLAEAAILVDGTIIEQEDLVSALGEMPCMDNRIEELASQPLGNGFNVEEYWNTILREYLVRARDESGGVKAEAARLLGYASADTLKNKLIKVGLPTEWSSEE